MDINYYLYIESEKERFRELGKILKEITFRYAVIKGEALSLQAFGREGRRISSDIDILISRKNVASLENTLKEYGFQPSVTSRTDKVLLMTSSHQSATWSKLINPWTNITLDINFDIFWGEYEGERVDIDSFLADTVSKDIFGVRLETLPPLKAFVHLALHNYKDLNSVYLLSICERINQRMFDDLYQLLKNNADDISVERLLLYCREIHVVPYVYYMLYYINLLFDDNLVKEYIGAFETPFGNELLNCYGLCDKERRPWRIDFHERLNCDNIYELIKPDLSEHDLKKISVNKRIFHTEQRVE